VNEKQSRSWPPAAPAAVIFDFGECGRGKESGDSEDPGKPDNLFRLRLGGTPAQTFMPAGNADISSIQSTFSDP
jgi:hypothetical protein